MFKRTKTQDEPPKPVITDPTPRSGNWSFFDLRNRKQSGDLEKKIYNLKTESQRKVFNFVSSRRQEGVTTVLANFLQYLREQGSEKKILIIDANFLVPGLHRVFNKKLSVGLADVLAGGIQINEAVVSLNVLNMSLLTCGKDYKRMAGNISLERFSEVIEEAKKGFDYVFIDSSPLLISSDAISTAIAADVTFLVIQALKVQREVARRSKSLLTDNACEIGGVILNRVPQVIPSWVYRMI